MESVFITQLSVPEVRQLLREEIQVALAQHASSDQEENKKILNFEEACVFLSISKSHGYKLTSKGLIPHSKRGKRIYFKKSDLEAYLLANQVTTVSDLNQEMEEYLLKNRK